MEKIKVGKTVVEYDVIKSDRKTLGIQVDSEKSVLFDVRKQIHEEIKWKRSRPKVAISLNKGS